ncbi:hypothetical protein Tco_0952054 [Tanacetum coccineum]|uniref:Uncharacterized protein n=1 Tax=Tanacetum coccineum TaxID=301880 RepID=A0ABQ5DWV2_9ASTR
MGISAARFGYSHAYGSSSTWQAEFKAQINGQILMNDLRRKKDWCNSHDAKALEHASVCLDRIAAAFAASSNQLDELCVHRLVKQAASFISTTLPGGGHTSLSTSRA